MSVTAPRGFPHCEQLHRLHLGCLANLILCGGHLRPHRLPFLRSHRTRRRRADRHARDGGRGSPGGLALRRRGPVDVPTLPSQGWMVERGMDGPGNRQWATVRTRNAPATVEKSPGAFGRQPSGGRRGDGSTIWVGHEGPDAYGFAIALTFGPPDPGLLPGVLIPSWSTPK